MRPEPPGANATFEASRFWGAQFAGSGRIFSVGNIVRFEAASPPQDSPFPHATEDRIVSREAKLEIVGQLTPDRLIQSVAAGTSRSLKDAFGGRLIRANSGKAYVASGERTCSLGAIDLDPDQIRFYSEVTQKGKRRLRAVIHQNDGDYDLSVPADAARLSFLAGGVTAVQTEAKSSSAIHVRVGLCRPFAAMPDCRYAQVNGLYFLQG